MAKFLTGNELNLELEKIFEQAKEKLILISPYIKLHDRYASTHKTKVDSHKLEIIVVFGKNEGDLTKSMKQEDFTFFKEFPNIEIRYEKRLHAKYYANESSAILSSMNLYSYSQDNNIEAGVLTKTSLLENIANSLMTNVTGEDSLDSQASNYFQRVIKQSEVLFEKKPKYENGMMGLIKNYKESEITKDKLTDFFTNRSTYDSISKKDNIDRKVSGAYSKSNTNGYCIRTRKEIPFNPKHPLSEEAFQNWKKFSNENYPEKFCHFSGEPSNGETSYAKPILWKNWKKAKEFIEL